jgi:hypothetical protein
MATIFGAMKRMQTHTGYHGLTGVIVETGIGAGTSYALGRIYHSKQDKWYGRQAPRLAAIAGKAGAVLSAVMGGPQLLTGALDAGGQAGVDAIFLEMGLRHAREKSGKRAVLIDKSAALPAGASDMASIGALGRAGAGRGMSWDQIEAIARGR